MEREESGDDKTEEPTEEKRKQFREEGNIPSPKEFMSTVTLASFLLVIWILSDRIPSIARVFFQRSWAFFTNETMKPEDYGARIRYMLEPFLLTVSAGAIALTVIPAACGLVITQFNWSKKALTFKPEKLNPFPGLQRMMGAQGWIELAKNLVKMSLIGGACYIVLLNEMDTVSRTIMMPFQGLLPTMLSSVVKLTLAVVLAGLVISVGDYWVNWVRLEKQMRMTKQQVKDEYKKQEGDPLVKSQRRRMAREFVMKKSLAKVPEANFIVTNPEHFSVAIRYVPGMSAPIIVAKGQDFLAFKIREIAKKHDIVIVENKPLARALYKTVKIGEEVPPSLYSSIIEVMKYIYQTRGKGYFDRSGFGRAFG